MSIKDKNIKVVLSKDASLNLLEIRELNNEVILRSFERVINRLKKNPFFGNQIQKRLIPSIYFEKYEITNLFRVELSNYYRLMYTVRSDSIEIICFVINIVDHKKYNKLFGYKNR